MERGTLPLSSSTTTLPGGRPRSCGRPRLGRRCSGHLQPLREAAATASSVSSASSTSTASTASIASTASSTVGTATTVTTPFACAARRERAARSSRASSPGRRPGTSTLGTTDGALKIPRASLGQAQRAGAGTLRCSATAAIVAGGCRACGRSPRRTRQRVRRARRRTRRRRQTRAKCRWQTRRMSRRTGGCSGGSVPSGQPWIVATCTTSSC
mmetsp:Transcript_10556/g.32905  ORF Transcript_10556/g.32905 Transcript_10556/m.32905 type:complete len:213 (-) Transcript_10556:1542-2180(-)